MKFLTLAWIAAAAVAQAQPSADDVIAKHVQALGGAAAIEKQATRVSKGTFEIPALGATGQYTGYAKAPNKILHEITIEGYGTVKQGYDGKDAWASNPERGVETIGGSRAARMARGAEFQPALRWKETYSKLSATGKEKVGEREAWVVEAVPKEGSPERLYFDAETGLLVRTQGQDESPDGTKYTSNTYLEDYRVVDGVKVPFTLRQESPQLSFVIKLSECSHNVPVKDAVFGKPAN